MLEQLDALPKIHTLYMGKQFDGKYVLLTYNMSDASHRTFSNLADALHKYFSMELEHPKGDFVLVKSSGQPDSVLRAYNNYFTDAREFIRLMKDCVQ